MPEHSNSPSSSEYFLVFAIVENPVLGLLLEPFAVKHLARKQYSYDYHRVGLITVSDYITDLSPVQKKLLELHAQYSDDAILKRFNKAKVKPAEFFQSLKQEFVVSWIRPIIDKKMAEMAEIFAENNIPLHFKGGREDRIREEPVVVLPGIVEPIFCFTRTTEGLLYKLKLKYQGAELSLMAGNARILAQNPCLLILDNYLYRFEKGWDGKKLTPFFTKEHILVPKSSVKIYFQKFVLEAVENHTVDARGFTVDVITDPPKPLVNLEQNWQNHWTLQVLFDYGRVVFQEGDSTPSKVFFKEEQDAFSFTKVLRNTVFENQFIKKLEGFGLKNRGGDGFYLWYPARKTGEESEAALPGYFDYIDWLSAQSVSLGFSHIRVQKNEGAENLFLGKPGLRLAISDKNDWFDLFGTVSFGRFDIPFLKLKSHILSGRREFTLPDGSIGIIPEEWFSKYQDILKYSVSKGNSLQLKRHHYTLLEGFEGTAIAPGVPGRALQEFAPPPLPDGIHASLRPYQLQGFQWMSFLYENKLGGCLADDMGLGKTIQTLAILMYAHRAATPGSFQFGPDKSPMKIAESGQLDLFGLVGKHSTPLETGTSLLIMPLSLIHNWLFEIKRFAPSFRVLQHTGSARSGSTRLFAQYHLVLTTYGTVRNDVDMLKEFHFQYIVLDESQIIKNSESKIFQAIKNLNANHRLVLTGTPIENSLTDLWAQFSFLNPGMLGTFSQFREEFVQPIERNHDQHKQAKLHKLIEPFILRRTKSEVAKDLPELTETLRNCAMTEEHQRFYEEKKSQIRNLILEQVEKQGMNKARFFILGGLMRLRLIANHPALVDPDYLFDSGKFTEVCASIENLMAEGHKVLIFSQFVKHLNVYKKHFEKNQLPFNMLTGQLAEKDRSVLITDFNRNPDKKLFLISLKAGGVGLNLTGADYVFLLDPWWNPAVEKQAINRAHRIGQKKNVFVYKFITHNTVEEKILRLQERKTDLANLFIEKNNPLRNLGLEEIRELIT